jgi:two-component system sensor histidine kinase YesM
MFHVSFARLSLTKKVILLYVSLILFPSCLLMYIYYQKSAAIIEKDMSESMIQTLKQAEINITYRLDAIENVSNSLISNPDLFRYLTSFGQPEAVQFQHFRELERLVMSMESNRDIHRIRLFIQPELYYSRENIHFFSIRDFQKNKQWTDRVTERNGSIYWQSTHFERFIGSENAYVLSSSRMLRDPANFDRLVGVLVIDIKYNLLQDILQQMKLAKSQSIYLLDQDGQILSHSDPSRLGAPPSMSRMKKTILAEQNEGYFRDEQRPELYTIFHRIPITNWTVVAEIPTETISGESVTLAKVSAVIVLAVSFVVFIFALSLIFVYVADSMSKRIKDLIRLMKKEGLESLDSGLPNQGSDLRNLEFTISSMVQTVKQLTEESYVAKLHEREAQLKALQAQINPHFLYNTLDSINWMAIRRNADDISQTVDSLSKYFRLSLNKGKDIVTLDEELQLVRAYIHIQNTRFSDGIRTEFHIDWDTLSCQLPKLTLQPIVENAVLHGIQQKKPKLGTLVISSSFREEGLLITVEDDGVGIEAEQLKQLLLSPSQDKTGSGYGLYNVQERIRLYSQDPKYGLTIHTQLGVGTTVEVLISKKII